MNQSVVEELQAQRDFLLNNTWVKYAPRVEGEGCLVGRATGTINTMRVEEWLTRLATRYILAVLHLDQSPKSDICAAGFWNDTQCQSAGEAIAVLDEAIRLAKEDMV